MSTAIRINVVIKASPAHVYEAVTTQEGLAGWWCKQTTAKPEEGFVNVFLFGQFRNEMKITGLSPGKKVDWQCIQSIDEWVNTNLSFDLEDKDGKTLLRFTHGNWREATDMYAACTYDWGRFIKSLKDYCETGTGTPA